MDSETCQRASPKDLSVLSVKVTSTSTETEKGFLGRSYVRYLVNTRFRWSDREDAETAEVWRRFREFDVLRRYLMLFYPEVIVAPLPEKRWSVDVNDLVRERLGALEVFLERCLAHPVVGNSTAFQVFVTDADGFGRLAEKVSSSSMEVPLFSAGIPISNPELADEFSAALEATMCMQQVITPMQKWAAAKERECQHFAALSESLVQWSVKDMDLADPLAISGSQLTTCFEHNGFHWQSQLESVSRFLQEYIQYGDAQRLVIERHNISPTAVKERGGSGGRSLAAIMLSGGKAAEESDSPVAVAERRRIITESRKAILIEVSRLRDQQRVEGLAMWREFTAQHVRLQRRNLSAWLKVKEQFQAIALEPVD